MFETIKKTYKTITKKISMYSNDIYKNITTVKSKINKAMICTLIGSAILLGNPDLEKSYQNKVKKTITPTTISYKNKNNSNTENIINYSNMPHGIAKKGQTVSAFVNEILQKYERETNDIRNTERYRQIIKEPRYWEKYLVDVNGIPVKIDTKDLKAGNIYTSSSSNTYISTKQKK